jgi:hypothetical protein
MGRAFADALGTGNAFSSGMIALIKGLGEALLVEVPKYIGIFLLETGVALGFPAGLPFILGGCGLAGCFRVCRRIISENWRQETRRR